MCLAQGPHRSDASEAQTHNPSVSSQALYHRATALPNALKLWQIICEIIGERPLYMYMFYVQPSILA